MGVRVLEQHLSRENLKTGWGEEVKMFQGLRRLLYVCLDRQEQNSTLKLGTAGLPSVFLGFLFFRESGHYCAVSRDRMRHVCSARWCHAH
jgi:hypothetical protein